MKKKIKPEEIVVSQSMIKAVREYLLKKLCGLVLQSKYITKTFPVDGDDSPAKKIGRYFEFILTGALPRSGVIPKPEYYKKALTDNAKDPLRYPLTVKSMTEPYQLAHRNAARVKEYFKVMKIRIIEFNIRIQRGGKEGTIDIIAMYKSRRVVIDVKYSGLLWDKWDQLGWMWTAEQRKFHGTQALQYHALALAPFYFLVVSSTNAEDIKFLDVQIDDFSREQHEVEVDDTRKKIKFYKEFGVTPYPELVRCTRCAIREGCQFRIDAPVPQVVYVASDE